MMKRSSTGTMKRTPLTVIKVAFMGVVALTMLFPFYWVTISSFKSNNDIFGHPLGFPTTFSFSAVVTAWNNARLGASMLNSLFYAASAIILIMLLSAMVSFILAQVRPNKALYAYFSFGLLIPIHAMIIPLNVVLNQLHLGHTRAGLVIAYVVLQLSLSVFLLTATMRSIPREMTDASIIDGCSGSQVFWRIILPLSRAGLATVGTLAFINCWNDLLLGMIIAPTRALQTVNVAVSNLRVSFSDNNNVLAAGITCMFIPSVIIYTLFQKQIIKGLVSGAVKG
jgi:raffinose/stachyose/melibiose transport system permease protein